MKPAPARAPGGWRAPGRGAFAGTMENAPASWSAAALRRCDCDATFNHRPRLTGRSALPAGGGARLAGGRANLPVRPVPTPDSAAPSGDFTAPSRDSAAPSGDFAASSRDSAAPSRDSTASSRDFAAPSRDFAASSRDFAAPSGGNDPPPADGILFKPLKKTVLAGKPAILVKIRQRMNEVGRQKVGLSLGQGYPTAVLPAPSPRPSGERVGVRGI
jgi:hypothetical protein